MTIVLALFFTGSLVGAATQRLTGMGFALVAVPLYVLAFGAWDAVTLVALVGTVICAGLTWSFRADIDWPRLRTLSLWSVIGTPFGTWVAAVAPPRVLEITASTLLVGGLLVSGRLRGGSLGDPLLLRRGTGAAAGVTNATAGLAGVPVIIYSRIATWDVRSMVATAQPMYVVLGTATLISRWLSAGYLLPTLSLWAWSACGLSLLLGIGLAAPVGRHVTVPRLMSLVALIAYTGCFAVVVRALLLR